MRRIHAERAASGLPLRSTLVLLTLAGFLLRAFALDAKDLRGDESFAAVFSSQTLPVMWHSLGQSEPHPPLYFVLLHAMIALSGPSNVSLRALSLLFGTLAIPALAIAAWQTFGPRAALMTALLTATNPLLIWQAQDARMYAQLVGCAGVALAGVAVALRADRPQRRALLAVLLGAAALLTHVYAIFIVAGLVAALLLTAWRAPTAERQVRLRLALAVAMEIGLIALPLLYHGRRALQGHPPFAALGLVGLVESVGQTLAGGMTSPIPLREPAAVLAIILAIVGLLGAWRRHFNGAVLAALGLAAPLLGLAILGLLHPAYQPAYVAVVAPAWLLAVGAPAIPRLPRGWLVLIPALLLLGVVSEQSLATYAASAKNLTFRQAAEFVQRDGRPGDFILTNYPDPTLNWVYHRQLGGRLPILLEPPAMPVDVLALDHRLIDLGERYNRLWFWTLRTADWDAQHATEIWLDRHALPLAPEQAGNVAFRLFETPHGFLAHTTPLPAVTFGGQLRVRGVTWSGASTNAGSVLDVTLCWQAVTTPRADYTAFVHLEQGTMLGGQDDHPPVNGLNPTRTWLPGESFLDRYHVAIPATTRPGVYAVRVGFYTPSTVQRLPVEGVSGQPLGDALTVGEITVR